jgi:hypothetical protein
MGNLFSSRIKLQKERQNLLDSVRWAVTELEKMDEATAQMVAVHLRAVAEKATEGAA